MHFRPRCVCRLFTRFVWAVDAVLGIVHRWLISFGQIACKWYFVCVELCGKIWWRLGGAVPVCPPVSPCRGASIVHSPRTMRVFFGMETPLRGRSGGHTGAAPTYFA